MADYQGAIADYNQALKINPNNAHAYSNRGFVRLALRDREGAIADFNQTFKISPVDAYNYNNRGQVRSQLGDREGAIADFNQALKIIPTYVDAYNNRGYVRIQLGDYQGAIADFNQTLKINPKLVDAYNNRGYVRTQLGDYQGAIADFNQTLKINPKLVDAYNNRGYSRAELGDKQGAIADFNQALKISPNTCKDGIQGNPSERIVNGLDSVVGSRMTLSVFKFRICPQRVISSGTQFLGTEFLPPQQQPLEFEMFFETNYEVLTSEAANILNSRSDRINTLMGGLIGLALAYSGNPTFASRGAGFWTGLAVPELQNSHTWSPGDRFTHKYKAVYDHPTRKTKITETIKLEGEEVKLQSNRKVKRNRVYINKTVKYTQDGIPFDTLGD